MAGPGGTNEIVVRIVSGLKGDGDDVVRKTRERAKKVRDTELKEKETTENAKERIAKRSLAKQRKLVHQAEEEAHKAKLDYLKSEDKFEASLYTRKNKRRIESVKAELAAQKRTHQNEIFLFNQRLAISKEEAKRKAAAQRKEELARRKADREAERASPQYIERQGYLRARRGAIAKVGRERYMREKGMALPGTPEYYEQQGYKSVDAAAARKAGREKRMKELGIAPAADQAAPKVKRVPLTYSQRRARAAAERNQYLAETYGSVEAGLTQERTQRVKSAFAARGTYEAERRRHILSGGTGRPWYSVGGKISDVHMGVGEQVSAIAQVATQNPYLKKIIAAAMAVFASAKSVYNIASPAGKEGVAMNRSFGMAQAALAGMENPQARTYNIKGRRYIQAAAMGRSPQDLLRARAASLQGAGGGVSDIETLAFMVNAQMGAGDAAQMMSMSMMRGNKGKDIKKDINRTFAIGVAAGFKEIARQPIFARSFAEYLSKGHVAGATREGAGSLLAAFTRAAPGGAISGLYGLDLIDKLQSGMAGPDPQSSLAAFQRYLIGYGRPGSTMDYFQAEDIRAGGIHERPELVKNIKDTIRSITRGSARQSRFMLRNVYGMTQPQAREFLSVGDILPVAEGGEDKFSQATAAARTPAKAKYYAGQNVKLMQATTELTAAFDRLRKTTIRVVEQNQDILKKTPDVITWWLNKWLGEGTEVGKYVPFAEHKQAPNDASTAKGRKALQNELVTLQTRLTRYSEMPEDERAQIEARVNQIRNVMFREKVKEVSGSGGANMPAKDALSLSATRTAASASEVALNNRRLYDQEAKARVEAAKKAEKENAGPMSALPQSNAVADAINQHVGESAKKAAQAMTNLSTRLQTPSVATPAGGKGQFQPPATPAP